MYQCYAQTIRFPQNIPRPYIYTSPSAADVFLEIFLLFNSETNLVKDRTLFDQNLIVEHQVKE